MCLEPQFLKALAAEKGALCAVSPGTYGVRQCTGHRMWVCGVEVREGGSQRLRARDSGKRDAQGAGPAHRRSLGLCDGRGLQFLFPLP